MQGSLRFCSHFSLPWIIFCESLKVGIGMWKLLGQFISPWGHFHIPVHFSNLHYHLKLNWFLLHAKSLLAIPKPGTLSRRRGCLDSPFANEGLISLKFSLLRLPLSLSLLAPWESMIFICLGFSWCYHENKDLSCPSAF